jgi:hypothetical protein
LDGNSKREERAGKAPKQAVALALHKAAIKKKGKRKKKG